MFVIKSGGAIMRTLTMCNNRVKEEKMVYKIITDMTDIRQEMTIGNDTVLCAIVPPPYCRLVGCSAGITELKIPAEIGGYPLRLMTAGVFANCDRLQNISFSDNLLEIPDSAFMDCEVLERVELPKTLQSIGRNAFMGCISLKAIYVPKSVCYIGNKALGYVTETGEKLMDFVIMGETLTAAESYAIENNITFIHR